MRLVERRRQIASCPCCYRSVGACYVIVASVEPCVINYFYKSKETP